MRDIRTNLERKSLPEPPIEGGNLHPQSTMGNGEGLRRMPTVKNRRDAPIMHRHATTESINSTGALPIADMTEQEVREALAISHERHMAAVAQLNIATETLASLHSTYQFRESDDSIMRKMVELCHDIKQWNRKLSPGTKKPGPEKKAVKAPTYSGHGISIPGSQQTMERFPGRRQGRAWSIKSSPELCLEAPHDGCV
ncbi:hypothetical protein IFR04_008508 [Cadophora malorum]|uniref:Uncharacterized protein n=1 Tax=Cadophora malorum TaxID=108018 RepID=A0A8H7TF73_9HELO|nr:hypothetical protein IFR04_008508 [Cadophora malorum]